MTIWLIIVCVVVLTAMKAGLLIPAGAVVMVFSLSDLRHARLKCPLELPEMETMWVDNHGKVTDQQDFFHYVDPS